MRLGSPPKWWMLSRTHSMARRLVEQAQVVLAVEGGAGEAEDVEAVAGLER